MSDHYTRQTSPTSPIGDTPLTRLRDKLATMPRVDGQGTTLAEAVVDSESFNRDESGRFASDAEPQSTPRLATGTTGLGTLDAQPRTPLARIRGQVGRHDHTIPDGFVPPAS